MTDILKIETTDGPVHIELDYIVEKFPKSFFGRYGRMYGNGKSALDLTSREPKIVALVLEFMINQDNLERWNKTIRDLSFWDTRLLLDDMDFFDLDEGRDAIMIQRIDYQLNRLGLIVNGGTCDPALAKKSSKLIAAFIAAKCLALGDIFPRAEFTFRVEEYAAKFSLEASELIAEAESMGILAYNGETDEMGRIPSQGSWFYTDLKSFLGLTARWEDVDPNGVFDLKRYHVAGDGTEMAALEEKICQLVVAEKDVEAQ